MQKLSINIPVKIMDDTKKSDELLSTRHSESDSQEPTPEKDPSTKFITGFLLMLFLFTATSFISQRIIFQALERFSEDIRDMEVICNRDSSIFNDYKCECIFNYLDGLDHPQYQIYFHKLKLPPPDSSKIGTQEKTWQPKGGSSPETLYIDPKAYVYGCGNGSPERRSANEEVCQSLEKLITTDLFTKWWYDSEASCYSSIFNTIKRTNPGLVIALLLVLLGVILTPIQLLQNFEVI